VAVVGFKIVEHLWRNNVKVSDGSREAWLNIDTPVSGSISYHHTGKVDFKSVTLKGSLLVILIDLPGEVWNINSTIAFTRDEQLVGEVFWELSKPLLKGS
jgi:hypothetical protein